MEKEIKKIGPEIPWSKIGKQERPITTRIAGGILSFQVGIWTMGIIGLSMINAVVSTFRGPQSFSQQLLVVGLGLFVALVGGLIMVVVYALFEGKKWGRTMALIIELVLIGTALKGTIEIRDYTALILPLVLSFTVLILMMTPPSRKDFESRT
jgi:hypothetical protein